MLHGGDGQMELGNIPQTAMGHYPAVGPHCGSLQQAVHCTLVAVF